MDSMSMVERMARAMAKRNYPGASDADMGEMWAGWVDEAKAALQALMEPTPGMNRAGSDAAIEGKSIANIYAAMIRSTMEGE